MLAEGERSVVKDGGAPLAAGAYAASGEEDAEIENPDDEEEEDAPRDGQAGAYDPTPDSRPSSAAPRCAYCGTSFCRPSSTATSRCSATTAPGCPTRRTATSGIRACSRTGARTLAAGGITCRATAGPGSAPSAGHGPRITTDDGASIRRAGSTGFRRGSGAPRGCPGPSRRATSAGAGSAGTDARSSASLASAPPRWSPAATIRGAAGPSCHRVASAAAMTSTAIASIIA